jgi:formate hydrogenlyase transcriptional activator
MDASQIAQPRSDWSSPPAIPGNGWHQLIAPGISCGLNLSQAQLRNMIDTIPALAWSCFPDGTTEFLNKRWLEYTGLSQQEATGTGWERSIHPEDRPALSSSWRAILASRRPGQAEARLRDVDGQYRWFLFRAEPFRDEHGVLIRWYGTITDIEESKHAQKELCDVVDYIPQQVAILGPDGRRLYGNRFALDYAGITLEQFQSEDYERKFIHPDDLERMKSENPILRGETYEFEARIRGKDQIYRWFLVRFQPLRDSEGRILRWYSSGTEIQDRKEAEERARNENIALREEIDQVAQFEEIVGVSGGLQTVLSRVAKVASTDSTVLITGETGTGKELIARAIHKRSARSGRAFVSVNCAAIPQSLIASELFGHEKGAFTGALQRRLGRFEMAEGGTLFLDEVGDLPTETQIALLRVLQEREFERVGGNQLIRSNVRVIAATNRDLKAAIATSTFRCDLFYRLNVFPIDLPPLRERKDDIAMLVEYFIDRYATATGKKIKNISHKSLELLESYSWPGNVRELQNIVERSLILCDTETFSVDKSWLPRERRHDVLAIAQPAETVTERSRIEEALARAQGRVSGPLGAAIKLGMPATTLESKIRSLKINKYAFRGAQVSL